MKKLWFYFNIRYFMYGMIFQLLVSRAVICILAMFLGLCIIISRELVVSEFTEPVSDETWSLTVGLLIMFVVTIFI